MSKFLSCLALVLAICLLLLGPTHASAGGGGEEVVSDCGDTGLDTQLRAKLLLAQERTNVFITFSCTGPIVLLDGALPTVYLDVTLDGGSTMVLSGGSAWRLFEVAGGGSLTLNNITLTKGYADGDGGAVYSSGALTINNSKFLGNQTTLNGNGGALIAFGTLTITNEEGDVTLTGVTLSGNTALSGGGIYTSKGFVQLAGVTLSGNTVELAGGGLFNTEGDTALTNVTVSGNAAGEMAAGIYNSPGDIQLTNVTLSGNSAPYAGGIFHEIGAVLLKNTLLAQGTTGENCVGVVGAFSLADDATCHFGGGRDDVDLLLGPLAANGGPTLTHLPDPASPALDGGTGAGCPAADQRGLSRTGPGTGSACDVGAVEYQAPLPQQQKPLYLPLIRPG